MPAQQRPTVIMEEMTDPDELAKARMQDERFERNWSSCGGRYGYHCIYTPLCEEPNSELVQLKKSTYVERELWRPWL